MKECPNCQASINDTAKFCRNCGFNVKKHGEENDFVFCEECGAKMLSDSTFCEECGARVINDSDIIENNTQSFDFSNLDEVTNLATDQLYEQNGLKVENGVLVEYIGKRRSVTIPGTIEEIFDGVFCGNQFISEVEIEEGVKIIGKNVFANCPCLTKISIPASCTKIYEGAFDGTNVDDFIITENNLETALFFVSEEERKVLLKYFLKTLINENGGKATIKEIKEFANRVLEEGAFREYDDKIVIDFEDKTVAKINDGVTSIGEWDRYYRNFLTIVEIPSSVTSINECAFRYCSKLTSIKIPNSVTSIEYLTFSECTSLTRVEFEQGSKCEYIAEGAFSNCTSLTSIEIPNSVIEISAAFHGCTSLTSIEIPSSVTSINECAFHGCTSLTNIAVDDGNLQYESIDGNLYTKGGNTFVRYAIGKTDTCFEIPNSVTSIGLVAFLGCTSLTSIEIPSSVTSIGGYAFTGCKNLKTIKLPKTCQCNTFWIKDCPAEIIYY